jgi:hypothetical protein
MKAGVLGWLRRLPALLMVWRARALGRRAAPPARVVPQVAPQAEPITAPAPAPSAASRPQRPLERPDPAEVAALADQLWGEGFVMPGGAAEANRLANLLPLSPATTLMLLGADAGGAAAAIAATRGAWVAAQQDDPFLAERMALKLRPLGRRASVATWDPGEPFFRHRYHHHGLALEPLRRCPSARLLPAIGAGLKPGGQLVLMELVGGPTAAGRLANSLERWAELEGRALPESAAQVEAALTAGGFTVNVREDVGARHCASLISAWQNRVEQMKRERPPPRPATLALVHEAERWLLRQRLMQAGVLRLLRWHCTRGPDRAGAL